MAISSGSREHAAWLEIAGQRLLIENGTAHLAATRESSSFSVALTMKGAEELLSDADSLAAKVIVRSGSERTLVTGELDSADFDYIGGLIHVSGRCKSAKLHEMQSSEKWLNQTPDEIIKDLAQRAGLSVDAMSERLKAGRPWGDDFVKLSDGVSAASLLHKLSEFMGARWWVDGDGKLHVKAKDDAAAVYSISYSNGGAIESDALHLRISKNFHAAKDIEVSVKSWNQKQKKVFEGKKTISGKGGKQKFEYHIAGLTQDHADRYAESKASEHARQELSLEAKCVGDVDCAAGMTLRLNGTRFAQDFEIDGVSHAFGMAGHTMHISARNQSQSRESGGAPQANVPTPPTRPSVPTPPTRPQGL